MSYEHVDHQIMLRIKYDAVGFIIRLNSPKISFCSALKNFSRTSFEGSGVARGSDLREGLV